jgi:hypothetical protein
MLQLHARRTENRSHRPRGSTLFPNHFANITLGDAQSNDSGLPIWNRLNRDVARVIDKSTSYLTDEVCHISYRIPPWRKLSCLSHLHTFGSGSHKETLKPVPSSRLQRDLLGSAETSETPVADNPAIRPAVLLCKLQPLSMQYQGVYVKRCAGHTGRTQVRQLSLGTIIAFPKLAVTK